MSKDDEKPVIGSQAGSTIFILLRVLLKVFTDGKGKKFSYFGRVSTNLTLRSAPL